MAKQQRNDKTQREEVQLDLCAAIDDKRSMKRNTEEQIISLVTGELNLMPRHREDINLSIIDSVIAVVDIDKSMENPIYKPIDKHDWFEIKKDRVGFYIELEGNIWRANFIKHCLLSGELKAIGRCYG